MRLRCFLCSSNIIQSYTYLSFQDEEAALPWLVHVEAIRALSVNNISNKNYLDYFDFDYYRTWNLITGLYKLNRAENNHQKYDHIEGHSSIYYSQYSNNYSQYSNYYSEHIWHISDYYINFAQTRIPPLHGWRYSEYCRYCPNPVIDPGLVLYFYPEELTSPPDRISLKTYSDEVSGSYSLLATTHNEFPTYQSKRFLYVRKYTNKRYLWVIGSNISDDHGDLISFPFPPTDPLIYFPLPSSSPLSWPDWINTGTPNNPVLEQKNGVTKHFIQKIIMYDLFLVIK